MSGGLGFIWRYIAGAPARMLMRVLSRGVPQDSYDGIQLIVTDSQLASAAPRFFDRTRDALASASSAAPRSYDKFRKDVRQIFFWGQRGTAPYNRFQLAVVVSPVIALEADTQSYAAWLLHASGFSLDEEEAKARSRELLDSLAGDERVRVTHWLHSITERGPPSEVGAR